MKIETHPRDDHQMTMIVEIDQEKMEGARHRAARKIAEKVKISGFRPGKAPYDVVRRLYGDAAITEEAVELLVDEIYPEALKDTKIDPGAAGQLENIESMDPPRFIFTVPLKPSVDLGEYKSVRLAYEFNAPGDGELEEENTNLRRMYAKTETVDRAVEDGDYVLVDVTGRKTKAKEDEEALVERKGFAIVARKEEKETEWPFPGFAGKLIGIKPGESKEFSHKYAKDFSEVNLAGQNVRFEVLVKTVRSVNMPALDDDFAKLTGLGQTVDELRQRLRENIEMDARNHYDDEYFEKLMDQIKAGATIKYPPQVLDHEVEHVLEDVERRLKSQGVENLEAYYKMIDSNKEKFIEEQARPTSVKRLERGLVMDELARVEKIEIDNESLEAEFNNSWASLAMNDQEFAKRTKNGTKASREIVDAVAMDSANRLLTRRVLDRIKAIATGEAVEAKPKPKKVKKSAVADVATEPQVKVAPIKKRVTKKKVE
ncbi:MAG TPA: trigger factor [Anaerolineales bacterium]